MSIRTPIPTPDPDDVSRGLAELEVYVAGQAAPAQTPEQLGETKRVRKLRAAVTEAQCLVELQADEAPLLVDTAKVRKRRAAVAEAARLYALSQDPTALAWSDARVRRITTVMATFAAAVALGVSSIGVQASVVKGLKLATGSPGWWAAYGVEPILSLPLLAAVAVQAYAAMRGRPVDRKSPEGRKLLKAEALLLGLTLLLNCWPAIQWSGFDPLALVVHSLGPLGAVTAIWLLPTFWKILGALPTDCDSASDLRWMHPDASRDAPSRGRSIDGHRAELARLISSGQLTSDASTRQIQTALRCRSEVAQALWRERNGKGA